MAVSKLEDVGSFDALFDSLDADPRVRGRQFEEICKWYLENSPDYHDLVAKVWPWREWEHAWGIDAGIDLVVEDVDGRLWAVQAKAYHPAYAVTKKDVDKFLSESSRKQFSYRLLIATTDKLHHVARKTINAQEKHVGFIGRADLLTAAVDWPKSPAVLRPAKPRKPARPHDYQREAIKDVVKGFKTAERGQLIMACGTGKTLTSLFIKEKLAAERTLVLLPSLSLLKQTMSEWRANAKTPFRALPVCSDESVSDTQDEPVAHTSELGLPDVTTDPAAISVFLRCPGPRVVFSTYQSSPQIAAAFTLGGVPDFDLAFADEAHRVAGDESTIFATILDADLIKAKRRLFMTATPRYYTGRVIKKAQESEMVVASMDDHTKFGEVFHRLSFGEAIRLGRLTDYQVAVIAVDAADETYREMAENGALLKRGGKKTDGHILASQIGLAKAMRKYNLRRLISFHSTIARARGFAAEMPEVIDWMPKRQRPSGPLWTGVATGEMTAGERHLRLQRLRHLEDGERGLLTNARCLSEGVDVPTLDGVAFIDPKGSEVDIIQAVGRAIRLAEDKTIGTIVIPVYIDSTMDPDAALNDSSFKAVWRVVKALRAHDEDLAEQIDAFRREMGRGGKPRVPDKIRLDVPATVGVDFADAFDVRLVERTAESWEFWFGLVERYAAEYGTARVPAPYVCDGGYPLGTWVFKQRYKHGKGLLNPSRVRRLTRLDGWTWDPAEDAWEDNFRRVEEFAKRNGHLRVPISHTVDGSRLVTWIRTQRGKFTRGLLSDAQVGRLESLPGWSWDPIADQWEAAYQQLKNFTARHGSCRVPHAYVSEGVQLRSWCISQRTAYARGKLSERRQHALEQLPGWQWDPFTEKWENGFQELTDFLAEFGHARVTVAHKSREGFNLLGWVQEQRAAYAAGKLDDQRRERLEQLPGWVWQLRASKWDQAFERLEQYVGVHSHARVPSDYVAEDGHRLGSWVVQQRFKHAQGKVDSSRVARLEALPGWTWDQASEYWRDGYERLSRFVEQRGTSLVERSYVEDDGFRLGDWVKSQRSNRRAGNLSGEREALLESLPGWLWDAVPELWEAGYGRLLRYVEQHGTSRVERSYVEDDGYRLGEWVKSQRDNRRAGVLSGKRQKQLDMLPGWIWDPKADMWEEGHRRLVMYVEQHGTSRVERSCVEDDGYRLGEWVKTQRVNQRNGSLGPERTERLDRLPGWTWDPVADLWADGYHRLLKYVEQHNTSRVERSYVEDDGYRLGDWVKSQRDTYRSGKLSEDRADRLFKLEGWSWDPINDAWEDKYRELVDYVEQHGNAAVKRDGSPLGGWVKKQRDTYRRGKLSEDRFKRLDKLPGWVWDRRGPGGQEPT